MTERGGWQGTWRAHCSRWTWRPKRSARRDGADPGTSHTDIACRGAQNAKLIPRWIIECGARGDQQTACFGQRRLFSRLKADARRYETLHAQAILELVSMLGIPVPAPENKQCADAARARFHRTGSSNHLGYNFKQVQDLLTQITAWEEPPVKNRLRRTRPKHSHDCLRGGGDTCDCVGPNWRTSGQRETRTVSLEARKGEGSQRHGSACSDQILSQNRPGAREDANFAGESDGTHSEVQTGAARVARLAAACVVVHDIVPKVEEGGTLAPTHTPGWVRPALALATHKLCRCSSARPLPPFVTARARITRTRIQRSVPIGTLPPVHLGTFMFIFIFFLNLPLGAETSKNLLTSFKSCLTQATIPLWANREFKKSNVCPNPAKEN